MTVVIMEFLVWLKDFLFSRRKNYQGRHWTDTVDTVEPTYCPSPIKYPGLWVARIEGTAYYLRVQARSLSRVVELKAMQKVMSHWGWLNVPTNEWPELWMPNGKAV